jgi:hypothetical protein
LAMRFDIGVTDIAADVKSSIASFGAAGLLA